MLLARTVTMRATFFDWKWMFDALYEKVFLIVLSMAAMVLMFTFSIAGLSIDDWSISAIDTRQRMSD